MPRAKPTQVIENRHTFGTFERKWVVEQEDWLKRRANIASAGIVAVPLGLAIGLGALGYGAYAGMCHIAGAIPSNPFSLDGIEKGVANAKVHWNRLTDPDWWKDPFGYEDKV